MVETQARFKPKQQKILSAPIMINLELTSGCNVKCRHCYNFWREDSTSTTDRITEEKMDKIIAEIKKAGVFHVVLTGGEPFMNFKTLEYALRELTSAGISTSVNSNLMIANPEKMKILKDAGIDHILTSLCSSDKETNDYMVNRPGSYEMIVNGIKCAVDAGVRVSVNMVVSEPNKDQVYETAKFCHELGVQRIFGTRTVPAETVAIPTETDMKLDKESALSTINQLLKAKEDFGIGIGTLIAYPLCMLGDLQKYKDFVGRGCPAQRGNRMIINANGETHACTHESFSYGNVFDVGIKEAFKKMRKWHDGSYRFEECAGCEYQNVCGSGCRAAASSYFKKMDAKDPLFAGKEDIKVHYKAEIPSEILELVDNKEEFVVPKTVRFRPEEGFYSINIRWANAYTIENELAEFLKDHQQLDRPINVDNMIGENPRNELLKLIFKEAVVPKNDKHRELVEAGVKKGCSVNPDDLPDGF